MATAVTVANMIAGVYSITLGAVNLGATKGGVELRKEQDSIEIECDQSPGTLERKANRIRFFVKASLEESHLVNLQYAWNQHGDTFTSADSSLDLEHTPGSELAAAALVFVGPGQAGTTRTVTITNAVSMGVSSSTYTKDDLVMIDVEFEAMVTVSADVPPKSTWGTIVDG